MRFNLRSVFREGETCSGLWDGAEISYVSTDVQDVKYLRLIGKMSMNQMYAWHIGEHVVEALKGLFYSLVGNWERIFVGEKKVCAIRKIAER